jgi:hypothetical protein
MIIHENLQKTCWYHQGISATSIPFNEESWNIVRVDVKRNKIQILTPILNRFFKRCRLWARELKWSRAPRQLLQREVGRRPYPSHYPQWRNQKRSQLFWALEEVEGSIFLHGRIQRLSRKHSNLSEKP